MRLLRLSLEGYGHFRRQDLVFGRQGVHIIYGPNEAGKTTLHTAIRDVMFGGPPRKNPMVGIFGKAVHRVSAEWWVRGNRLAIERRPGPSGFVGRRMGPDGDERELSLDGWMALLGGMTRELHGALFAFTLSDLAKGEELIRHGRFAEVLAGGALGSAGDRVPAVVKELAAACDDLWRPRGQRIINKGIEAVSAAWKKSEGARLRREDLAALRAEQDEVQREWERTGDELREVKLERSRIQRLTGSKELALKVHELSAELESLGPVGAVGDGVTARDVLERLDSLVDLERRIEDLDRSLKDTEGLAEPGETGETEELLLRSGKEVDLLIKELPAIRTERTLLEEDRRDLKEDEDDLAERLREVLPAGEVPRLQSGSFRRDLAVASDDVAAWVRTEEAVRLAEEERDRRRAEWAGSGEGPKPLPRDDQVRQVKLEECWPEMRARYSEWDRESGEALALGREWERLSQRLPASLLPGFESGAVMPTLEGVREAHREWTSSLARVRETQRAVQHLDAELAAARARRTALGVDALPTEDELRAARAERDHLGKDLEQAPSAGAWRAFFDAMGQADAMVDLLRQHAHQVLEIRTAERDMAALVAQRAVVLEQLEGEVGEAQRKEQHWRDVVAPLGIGSAPWPEIVQGLEALGAAQEARDRWQRSATRTSLLAEALEDFRRLASRAYGKDLVDAESALAEVKLQRDRRTEALAAEREAERRRAQALSVYETNRERAVDLARAADEARERADASLRRLGLVTSGRSDLDARLLVELSHLVEKALEMRRRYGEAALRSKRLERHDSEVTRVAALLERHVVGGSARWLEDLGAELQRRRGDAEQRSRAAAIALRQRRDLDDVRTQRDQHLAALRDMLGDVSIDRADLRAACRVALDRETLLEEIAENEQKLERNLRKGGDPEGDRAALLEYDVDRGQMRDAELSRREDALAARQRELSLREGQLNEKDSGLGSDVAMRARSEWEEQRSSLAGSVETFVEWWLASRLLQEEMDAFAREQKPAILASASEIMKRLTGGRHRSISVHQATQRLVLEDRDGISRGVDQLSTGVHQQMFLALRLAFVSEYGKDAECLPLVMDDVLANVDEDRQRCTLDVLAEMGERIQVLYLTCHAGLVDRAREMIPGVSVVSLADERELPDRGETQSTRAR